MKMSFFQSRAKTRWGVPQQEYACAHTRGLIQVHTRHTRGNRRHECTRGKRRHECTRGERRVRKRKEQRHGEKVEKRTCALAQNHTRTHTHAQNNTKSCMRAQNHARTCTHAESCKNTRTCRITQRRARVRRTTQRHARTRARPLCAVQFPGASFLPRARAQNRRLSAGERGRARVNAGA